MSELFFIPMPYKTQFFHFLLTFENISLHFVLKVITYKLCSGPHNALWGPQCKVLANLTAKKYIFKQIFVVFSLILIEVLALGHYDFKSNFVFVLLLKTFKKTKNSKVGNFKSFQYCFDHMSNYLFIKLHQH